jgi:hypothetical protein
LNNFKIKQILIQKQTKRKRNKTEIKKGKERKGRRNALKNGSTGQAHLRTSSGGGCSGPLMDGV